MAEACFRVQDVGWISVYGNNESVEEIRFLKRGKSKEAVELQSAVAELQDYFAGKRKAFKLRLKPKGTDFQKRVWKECSKIQFGESRSYGEIAKKIGKPQAARAVGQALGKNPIPIVIPCHRVLSSNEKLGGFSGGLSTKKALLRLEKISWA